VDGHAGSEADVRKALIPLIGSLKGKVAVACFASNVARMDSIARAAEANGRRVVLAGRSMHRMSSAAKSVGLMEGLQPFLDDHEAKKFPADKVLYLCTGSQGEGRAALSRIADGTHPHVSLGAGDACIFSSRVIPGNEIPIRNLQDRLADRGVRLYTERDHPGIHVSGHPCRDELAEMYRWARPEISVPTHGERRHLLEHAAFARDLQVPQQVTPRNGDMVRLAPGRAQIIDEVPAGRLYVDGGMVTVENGDALRERRHAASNGVVAVSVVLDGKNKIVSGPQVRALGLPSEPDYPLEDILDDLADEAEQALNRLKGQDRELDETVEAAMSRAVKKASQRVWGRRPVVETTVLRL
jgi:ribonuclease J